MVLPKPLVTVTPLSKFLAMILFILFPFGGFYLGRSYQKNITLSCNNPISQPLGFPNPSITSNSMSQPTSAPKSINQKILTLNGLLKKPISDATDSDMWQNVKEIRSTVVSPDQGYVCFTADNGLSHEVIYLVSIDGNNFKQIAVGSHCTWAPNSKFFAYTKYHADSATPMIAYFNLQTSEETEPQISTDPTFNYRAFEEPFWESNGNTFFSKWTKNLQVYNTESLIENGTSRFDTRTGTVTDL